MSSLVFVLTLLASAGWLIALLLPWQPWRVREVLEADEAASNAIDISDVTVIIPARNEAEVIEGTLEALKAQGQQLKVVLVDDDSSDNTVALARQMGLEALTVIESKRLPKGWTGKLWAQEQGLQHVDTPYTLLLDADIKLEAGMIKSLKNKLVVENLQFISLMAALCFDSFWEKLLMPAFVYFFKMLYPFALSNNSRAPIAAAAGGCIFVETRSLREIGGMSAIKQAVIDDCSLAKQVKSAGFKTWIGLTHGVKSQRRYQSLNPIWNMVARTAYTQLGYSVGLLAACTVVMLAMYWVPVVGLMYEKTILAMSCVSLFIMWIIYIPTLKFYAFSPLWGLALPIIAGMFLLMTWTSAVRYWQGERSRWKGRVYEIN